MHVEKQGAGGLEKGLGVLGGGEVRLQFEKKVVVC